MKHSRSTLLAMLAAGSLALLHGAEGAFAGVVGVTWDAVGNGDFQDENNWDPVQVPGIDDDVFFNNVSPTVTFTANAFSNSLTIENMSDVTFDLAGFTYAITNDILIDDSILTILDGVLSAATVNINNGGELVVGLDATLNVTDGNTLIVGDDDSGDLTIEDGGTVNAETLIVGNQALSSGFVDVQTGGALNTGSAIIGNETDSFGWVDVAGMWTNDGQLIVGHEGQGILMVFDDGEVTTDSLIVGNQDGGEGFVELSTGGMLTTGSLIVANDEGSVGTVVINADSSVTADTLVVGNAAMTEAAVTIGADGLLATGSASVGAAEGSSGTVNVFGTWTNDGDLVVGTNTNGGAPEGGPPLGGFVNVEATGTLTTATLTVGTLGEVDQAAGGVLVVSDSIAAESLDPIDPEFIGAGLHVGAEGTGSLAIVGGGQVTIADGATIGTNGGTGSVTVSGDDEVEGVVITPSTLDITGDLTIGDEGDGELNVEDGAEVLVGGDAFIGNNGDGGSGQVNVTGEDSLLVVAGTVDVGNSDAALGEAADEEDINAVLNVGDGANVIAALGITVNETGLVMGDGLITGDVSVFGRLAPGASIGTLNIDGNLDLEAGSILQVEYNDTPLTEDDLLELFPNLDPEDVGDLLASDLVAVTGTATLNDGTQIQIVKLTGGPVPGDAIIIVQSDTGITVDPEMLEIEGTFLVAWTAEVIMSGGDEFLLLTAEFDPDAFDEFVGELSGNLLNVANALGEGAVFDVLGALDPDDPQAGLLTLLPLQHGTAAMQGIRTSQLFNRSFMNEMAAHRSGLGGIAFGGSDETGMIAGSAHNPAALAQAVKSLDESEDADSIAFAALQQPGSWGGFIRGLGAWDRVDSDGADRVGHRARVFGVHGGVHNHLSSEMLLGLSLAYLNTDLDFRSGFGEGEIHTVRVGPYLSWAPGGGDFFIDASATYGYHRNEIDRETILGTARSRYDAHDISILGQVGIDLTIFDRTVLTPMGGIEFTHLRTDSFRERGAGAANLSVSSQSTDSLRLRLGAKLAHAIDMVGLTIVPEVYAGWAHEFLDRDISTKASFGVPGSTFTTKTRGVGRDAAQIAAGVSALLDPNMAVFVRYEGEFQSGRRSHGVVGGLNLNF